MVTNVINTKYKIVSVARDSVDADADRIIIASSDHAGSKHQTKPSTSGEINVHIRHDIFSQLGHNVYIVSVALARIYRSRKWLLLRDVPSVNIKNAIFCGIHWTMCGAVCGSFIILFTIGCQLWWASSQWLLYEINHFVFDFLFYCALQIFFVHVCVCNVCENNAITGIGISWNIFTIYYIFTNGTFLIKWWSNYSGFHIQ